MNISIVEWQQLSVALNSSVPSQCNHLLCQLHIHCTKQPQNRQAHNSISISTHIFLPQPRASHLDSIFIHISHIHFYCSPTPLSPHFCLVYSSIFIAEFELKRYSIFSPSSQLACSQVRTQYFHSFTVSLASIFSSACSAEIPLSQLNVKPLNVVPLQQFRIFTQFIPISHNSVSFCALTS